MDVIYPSKAAGGSDIFQSGGFGELRIGQLGDQDEYVEIDSDDSDDAAPQIVRNGTSAGARTGAKSMAGSSLAPREVSSASSHGRRETNSVRRSSRSIVAGIYASLRDSDVSVPKTERSIPKELPTQMSGSARNQGLSKSLSKSVEDEAGDAQMISKRKAEPSTSTTPVKRAKVNPSERIISAEEKRASQKGDSPPKREENFEEEGTLKGVELAREKRHRKLVLGDDTDDEDPQCTGNQESDAKRKNLVKVSPKKDSGLAIGSGKQVIEKQRLSLPGENGVAPFRSAFPLHARKKVHPPVSGNSKAHAGSRFDERKTTWATCTKCKKLRKVNADVNLKRSTWCCEKNTRDPKYASCSAPQEQNDFWKAGEVPADELEILPKGEAKTKEQVTLSESKDMVKDKDIARRNMVWVKLQVDGKELYWPGLQITDIQKCDSAIQKKIAKGIKGFTGQTRAVRLFHPREDLDEVQVVKRSSSVKPFQQARLSYKDSSSHPVFVTAVTAADEYYVEPDASMDMFSQPASGSNEDAIDEDAGCQVEDAGCHEEAESNEPESEGPETPGDDPQESLPQTDNEIEIREDGEVNQVPVEEDASPEAESGPGARGEAGNGSSLSGKRQSSPDKERETVKDQEAIQVAIEQGKAQNASEARNGERNDSQSHADRGEEVLQGSVERVEDVALPKTGDMVASVDKRDDPPLQAEVVPKVEPDVEASGRTIGSESPGLEELYGSGGPISFDLEIAPKRRLIAYDVIADMLLFQDGSAVSISPDSLGKELGKSSSGSILHKCIREVGKRVIRRKFPKRAKSSNGLKFNALDPGTLLSKRLRETWLREFGDEPMPECLKTRFVAGCIMEERRQPVNWAHALRRAVRQELTEISAESRKSLSPAVLMPILRLLEKQAVHAPLPTFEPVKGEEPVEHDPFCQQCKHSGELLCCDGKGCRKTYHLKCLNPPLAEPPSGAFFCPSCAAEASKPTGVDVPSSSVGINLPENNESRQGPQGAVNNSTKGADHQLPKNGIALAASNDSNIVVDLGVSRTVADATIGEKSRIENTLRVVVDSEKHVHHQKMPEPSISIDLGTRRASPSGLEKLGSTVQVGSSPPLTDNVSIVEQRGTSSALEEGEISPSDQAIASDKAADISVSEPTIHSPPLIISAGGEPPRAEEEFPSSDDHNSICEGCEAGGELMYVTTPSLPPSPSSPLLLCDGNGCKVVYHKECLNPPLQTVPAGEWFCPACEKGKVEKIWSVRMARTDSKSSDVLGDQRNIEDAQVDLLLDARFGQHPYRVNESDKASGSRPNEVTKQGSVEYLVQWKSRSHVHDTWVLDKELEKLAPKELARFKKLLQEGQLYHVQEKFNPEWGEPERVIQKRLTKVPQRRPDSDAETISPEEVEWFVKWKGLGYEQCTWEPADAGVLATPRGIELINDFESWKNAAKQRAGRESQAEAEKRVKLPIKDLDTQPEWMVRPELLPLQLEALNKLRRLWHSRTNGILVYEASQEKIVMTIMFFLSLVEDYGVVRPILVVVPRSLIQNWELELNQWASKLYIVNYSSAKDDARTTIRRTEFSSFDGPFKPQIVLATFDVISGDMEHIKRVEWEALVIDEGRRQRVQKSNQKYYRTFSQIRSIFRLLLLSEPLKSNVEELTQFVSFLGKTVVPHGDDMTQVAELQRRLSGRVLEYIPENRLTEYWVPVEMTPVQLEQYYYLLVKHYPTLSRNLRDHQIQDVVTKLRQSCNHPLLADPALNSTRANVLDHHIDISGKMRLLHLIMPILKAANWRILIFSQETKQLDILERYMTQSHGYDSYERVDSDLATKAKEAAIQRFNAEGSKRFVLLLKTGVHISFKNVQFLLLYDSDWNPANDMRALHKIHNEGETSSKPLPVLRLYTHLTVEESSLILVRDEQLPQTRATVSAKTCQKLLTWGAKRIFDRYDNDTGRPRGASFGPKAKPKQVIYNAEVVKKLMEAVLCQEEGQKLEGDELLKAILVPRDEPAKLFAESDHPTNVIVGDSAEAFWTSSLKWRHEDWQAKEVTMLGKGQRGKKRSITYDEDAMATAALNKAQLSEESERKRPRRRKASSEEQEVVAGPSEQEVVASPSEQEVVAGPSEQEVVAGPSEQEVVAGPSEQEVVAGPSEQEVVAGPSAQVPTGNTSMQVTSALHSSSPATEQVQESMEQQGGNNDEDAMATAALNKAQLSEESDRKRPRRRKARSEEQEVVAGPSAQVPTENTSMQVTSALHSNSPATEQVQENIEQQGGNTATQSLGRSQGSAQGPVNASNRNAGAEVAREPPRSNIDMFWDCLPPVCVALDLPKPVMERVEALLRHFIQFQKNTRKARATYEIIAIELAVVWLAAKQLNYKMDKMECISKVEQKLGTKFDNRPQLMGPLYNRVVELLSSFQPPPAPPAAPQAPESSSSGASAQNPPPRADIEPSPRSVSIQASEGEKPVPENAPAVSQETIQPGVAEAPPPGVAEIPPPVVAEMPSPVVAPLSTQGTTTDEAPAAEESQVEADAEVVFVGADPRLVPDEPLIDQSRFNVPDPSGVLVSGASMVEQGKGWVLVNPASDMLVEEQAPVVDPVAAPVVVPSSTLQSAGHISSQRGREAVSGVRTSEVPVKSTSPPLTQTQVPPTQTVDSGRQNELPASDSAARLKERYNRDMALIIAAQRKESALSKSHAYQKLEELKRKHDASRRAPTPDASVVPGLDALYISQKRTWERLNQADFVALDARQRSDRDKLRDLYSKLTFSAASGEGAALGIRLLELEIQKIRAYYSKFSQLTPSPLQGSSLNQRPALRTMPPGPSTTAASPTSAAQAAGGSRAAPPLASATPAENQQRQHVGRSSSQAIPVAVSGQQQQQGHAILQSSPQQRSLPARIGVQQPGGQQSGGHRTSVHLPGVQQTGGQSRAHPQRSVAPVHPSPAPNLQRGGAVASRGLSAPPLAPAALSVGHVPRPAAPSTVTQAGNVSGHVYPDVLLKEKEKLNKDLEKAKTAYELESQRIKAEYDKEAEILHKKYEALLIDQHRSFTKRQQQVQQNIVKVEWNRQLAEALKAREELANRAGFSQAAVASQQAPQQVAARQQPGGVHASIPRATTNAGNTGLGISSVTGHPPGTFSTRISNAPVQHPARYGGPAAAPQQEPSRHGMAAPPPPQQQEAPRYGMPLLAPRSEQPRSSSISGIMAVLAATANAVTSGNHVAAPVSRVQQEGAFIAPPEPPTNLDPGAGSPRPQTTGAVAPMPPPSFQDPILSIIRNSVPSLPSESPAASLPVVIPPMNPQQSASTGIIQGGSLLNPQSGAPEIPQSSEASPGPDVDPGARPDELRISEGAEVLLCTEPELQEHLVANDGMQDTNVGMQEQPAARASVPPSLIYLSDSDED